MKEKISQVIVVEGRDDTANLKRYFDVETYETRGSAIKVCRESGNSACTFTVLCCGCMKS